MEITLTRENIPYTILLNLEKVSTHLPLEEVMNNIIPRKDSIILATIDVLDQRGIQGLTIKEIANRAGISEGAIFKHFKSKNDLISAVLDHFHMFDKEIKETIEMKEINPREAIVFIISSYASYLESYPALTALNEIMNELTYEPELADKVMELYIGRVNFTKKLIEEAQAIGEINPKYDSEQLAIVIIGSYKEISLNWRFQNRGFLLSEEITKTLDSLLTAFSH